MFRHRRGASAQGEESSSDEEDAFMALSRKNKTSKQESGAKKEEEPNNGTEAQMPLSTTSSMKRHHGALSDKRKAKMDALLMELEAEKNKVKDRPRHRHRVPEKKGSFVEPGEEHLTTNIFVGNLAPSITEEEMTDLFRQFGDLYSVKIMWPRTPEERSRQRHTGFVCFMNRADAEEAMEACNETDPFNVGRRIMMRWGKNVKKIVKRGTGGIAVAPIQKKTPAHHCAYSTRNERAAGPLLGMDPSDDKGRTIRVLAPEDPRRTRFISTVASFVAKDGSQLECRLRDQEANNPEYNFLSLPPNASERERQEHIYYRWRVYSMCQGDSFYSWRTDPFVMFQPHGCTWIPPPLDAAAARREEEESRLAEERLRRQKQERRFHSAKKDYVTGRQLEQARKGVTDGSARLTKKELAEFDKLVKKQLCASREAICEAMAFCFEKSGAARQISSMLKELLLDNGRSVSVETRIARLYLLSDILFNSQQPGVRNAFLYRDAIERMAPDVFTSLGAMKLGRMSQNRLAAAISAVLCAWTNWSVYNPSFLDELHARFEGREIPKEAAEPKATEESEAPAELDEKANRKAAEPQVISAKPRGDWTTLPAADSEGMVEQAEKVVGEYSLVSNLGEPLGAPVGHDGDADGEPLDDDADGEPFDADDNVDGKPLEDDADGEPLDEDNVDGESLEDDADGEPLDEGDGLEDDADGEPLGEDDQDGKPLEEEAEADGEPLDEDNADSGPLDEELNGGPLNADADHHQRLEPDPISEPHDGVEDDISLEDSDGKSLNEADV